MATEKMKRFVDGVVRGSLSLAESYRAAYDTHSTPKAQRNEASRLWRNPLVIAYAERVRRDMEGDRARKLAADRDRIRDRLWYEADNATRSADRIGALKLLGQQTGVNMFSDRLDIVATRQDQTSSTIAADIETLLAEALDPEVEKENFEHPTPPPPLLPERLAPLPKHQNAQDISEFVEFAPVVIDPDE